MSTTVQLAGLTLRHGRSPDFGGALNSFSATSVLILSDVVVRDSTAANGGGIALGGSSLLLERSTVAGNVASSRGGGIFAERNVAASGLEATDSEIRDNVSALNGGGIDSRGDVSLDRVTIAGNRANGGGGGASVTELLIATNSTISGNDDANGCGGLALGSGTAGIPDQLSDVTITDNTNATGSGGGICNAGGTVVRNSIIAGNHGATGREPDCSGGFTSGGHNVIGAIVGGVGLASSRRAPATRSVPRRARSTRSSIRSPTTAARRGRTRSAPTARRSTPATRSAAGTTWAPP